MNEHVDPTMAKVLNAFATHSTLRTLHAFDAASVKILNESADLLCETSPQREMLQMIYDLGRRDGQIEQLKGQLANLEAGALSDKAAV